MVYMRNADTCTVTMHVCQPCDACVPHVAVLEAHH